MALAFVYQGNASFGSDALLVATLSGGPAAAGDLLVLNCMGGVDGGGLGPIEVFDNLDPTGADWNRLVDEQVQAGTPDTYTLHSVVAWKYAAGGETSVSINFTAGNANKAMEVVWLSDAAAAGFTEAYLLQKGAGAFDSGSGHQVLDAAPPGVITSDGEAYIGFTASSRDSYSFANLLTNGAGADAGGGSNVGGAANVILHHWYGSGSGLTTDVEQYATNTYNNPWMGVLGVRVGEVPPEEVDLEGTGTFGLDGTGELDVTAGVVDLAGDGTFGLGGEGELEQTGGDQRLAGVGTLGLAGTGFLSAPFPHPVPGPPDLTDTLGCGLYEAIVFTRGLGQIVGMLPFGEVDWGRVLDGVSVANLNIDGVANRSQLQKCCQLLGEVEPFEHELALYRNGYRCWSGPITAMSFPPNQIQLSAFDLAGWLKRRTLHSDYNAVQQDLITIWINYVQDAMAVDNSPGLHPTALALSGILADRLTQLTEHNVAADAIGELERTGIDWTTVDRIMQAGPVLTQPPAITDALEFPLLIDESFRVAPTILLDGMQGANTWYVQGGAQGPAAGAAPIFGEYGPEFDATPDHVAQPAAPDYQAIEDQYGRLESVVSESRVLDQPSIDANAKSRYDLTKRPVAVISEGLLLPSAPIAMRKLVPGSLVQVHLANACKPVGDFYRIKSVKVQARGDGSEDVNVEFQPLGTGTVLDEG